MGGHTPCRMPTVPELRARLKELGLPSSGNKPELEKRLAEQEPYASPNCAGAAASVVSGSSQKRNRQQLYDSTLDAELVECPVCLETFSSSIFQCAEGHMICEACKPKVEGKCPTCRAPLGNNRNRAIEQ